MFSLGLWSETFRLKELFVESNSFLQTASSEQSSNDACERVSICLQSELGLRRWKDFLLIAESDLTHLPDISADEAVQVAELVKFSRDANWGSLKMQFDQVQQSMEVALKNYAALVKNLTLFQQFVTVGAPLDASLNELSSLKTKLFDQRDTFMSELGGTQANAVGESVEEDATRHAARGSSLVLPTVISSSSSTTPPNSISLASSSSNSASSVPTATSAAAPTSSVAWRLEPTSEATSFRQQLRSLQLTASNNKLFRKMFVDPNVPFISFIGERRGASQEDPDCVDSMVITFEKRKNSSGLGESSLMLMQSASGDELMRLSAVGKAKEMLDVLTKIPMMADYELSRIKDPLGDFKKSLLALETKMAQANFKIGVIYVRAGQTKEDELLSNPRGSRAYEEFLKLLGDKVTLKGWKKFTAGLDTRDGRNGADSIFATVDDQVSVMFHVATMMLHENDNEEHKLERKRHIGNDIVCVVFCDEGATFNPASIRTEFTHVYAVVSPVTFNHRLYFKLEMALKDGVAKFGPLIPNCLFPNSKSFGQYLLIKLINADLAASNAPVFKKRITRTRNALLGDIIAEAKTNKLVKKGYSSTTLVRDNSSTNIKGLMAARAGETSGVTLASSRSADKRLALPNASATSSSSSLSTSSSSKDKDHKSPR